MPKKLTMFGVLAALVLGVFGLAQNSATATPAQSFCTHTGAPVDPGQCTGGAGPIDWFTCFEDGTGVAATPTGPGAPTCGTATSATAIPVGTGVAIKSWQVIRVPYGSILTLPTTWTPGTWTYATPAAGATTGDVSASTDILCTGGTPDILSSVGAPPGPATDWPGNGWTGYSFIRQNLPPVSPDGTTGSNNAYVDAIKPMPSTFTDFSLDRSNLLKLWLNGITGIDIPPTDVGPNQGTPLQTLVTTDPYATPNGMKVSVALLGGDPNPPTNAFLCLDSPQDSVAENDEMIPPSVAGWYPRWTAFTSDKDHVDGQRTRILDVQCMNVGGMAPATDSDSDCLLDSLEPGLGTLTAGPTAQDFDGDGVIDGVEVANGTNPLTTGSADDGVSDYTEMFQFTNPASANTDGDSSGDLQDDLSGFNCVSSAGACTVANLGDTTADDNCPVDSNGTQENYDSQPDWTNSPSVVGEITTITAGPPAMITTATFSGATGDYVTTRQSGKITSWNGATPTVVTTTGNHGLSTGMIVTIAGVPALNGVWTITKLTNGTFSLNLSPGTVAGTGGPTSTWALTPNDPAINAKTFKITRISGTQFTLDGVTSLAINGGTWNLIYRGDATNPHQDPFGDACDPDSDNDSMNDVVEPSFKIANVIDPANGMWCQAASYAPASHLVSTGVLNSDTDADGGLDGRECSFNSDPSLALVKFPAAAGCPGVGCTDPDGDLLFNSPGTPATSGSAETFFRTQSINKPGGGSLDDLEQVGSYTAAQAAVTSSSVAVAPIVITTTSAHGLVNGQTVTIAGNLQAAANVTCNLITAAAGTTFTLVGTTGGPGPATGGTWKACPPDLKIGPNDPDADGDFLNDGVEVKFYLTDPSNFDTDSDGCSDGREAADVNGDHKVDSTDGLGVAQHTTTGTLAPAQVYFDPGTGKRRVELSNYDVNKDNKIDSTDGLLVAKLTGNCANGTGAQTFTKPVIETSK